MTVEKVHRFRELFSKAQEKIGDLSFWEKFCLLIDASWENTDTALPERIISNMNFIKE